MKQNLSKSIIRRKFSPGDYTIAGLLIILFLTLALLTGTFFTYNNLYSLTYGLSIQFFAAIGLTLLVIMGEIDLAVGAMYGLSGTLVGFCMTVWKWNLLPAMLVILIACSLFGLLVGFIITKFRLNSFMGTLGTLSLLSGINAVVFNSFPAVTYSKEYRALAKFKIFDVHWTIIAAIVLVIIIEVILKYSSSAKKIYYIGNGQETARLYGIKTNSIIRISYSISAFFSALGGIIATSRITHSDILTGSGLEFVIITGLVLGGASLLGGRGSMVKSFLGMLFVAILSNGMTIFRIEPFAQQVTLGVFLILSVFIDSRLHK